MRKQLGSIPFHDPEDAEELDPTRLAEGLAAQKAPMERIVFDEGAANEEPAAGGSPIAATAEAQTDRGRRRKRNEDALLAMLDHGVFVIADGMGGARGGEIASALAVETIQRCFLANEFPGPPHETIPELASQVVRTIHAANAAIYERARQDTVLEGMGTTLCVARLVPAKQRLYIAHVGDSRVYRLRGGTLTQMTVDHTMRELGVTGEGAHALSRTVGTSQTVRIDLLLAVPSPEDIYLLCSDGLTKMVEDAEIAKILGSGGALAEVVSALVERANENGGKDNVTVIVVQMT
jgi:protein phosphatase